MEIKVEGKIIGKQRPRANFRTGIIYTPSNTKKYERLIKSKVTQKVDGAIAIDLECHFKMPKWSNKKRKEMVGKPTLKKPDIDNITKIYLDALNQVAYDDDKQVYQISATKVWDTEEYVLARISSKNDII
jgi:Holliday junction resolvase RusA-like endonuclease